MMTHKRFLLYALLGFLMLLAAPASDAYAASEKDEFTFTPFVEAPRSWMTDNYFFAPYYTPFTKIDGDVTSLTTLEKAARDNKDWETVYRLARMYDEGITYKKDKKRAEILLLEAADGGKYAPAEMALGVLYNFKGDINKARIFFNRAAKQNISAAIYELGLFYEFGRGIFPNHQKALEHYQQASDAGILRATLRLAYLARTNTPPDYSKAITHYERALTQTEDADLKREISIEVAHIYSTLAEDQGNLEDIFTWKKKAAEWGDPMSVLYVANAYFHGNGTATDYESALIWYEKAMNIGSTSAMTMLGYMYANGISVTVDFEKAVQYYTLAAERGNPEAAWNLGLMYQYGHGVVKDMEKSQIWFTRAERIRAKINLMANKVIF